nr:hypothetical protein [uncultured Moellerella sp.]
MRKGVFGLLAISLFMLLGFLSVTYLMQLNKHIGDLTSQNRQLKIELVKQKNITDNAYRTITLFDRIAGAHRDIKNQISENTKASQRIINNLLSENSCADEYIPDAVTQQLHQQAARL